LENGKIARFCGESDQAAHGSTEFIVIRGRTGVTDSSYAYYLTKWEGVRGYAISQMTGTSGRQRVPKTALDHLLVPVPPLSEQRAIAHILGTLDDKIEMNRRLSETLESIARALFRSWFVDFDPVRAKIESRWQSGQSMQGLPAHLFNFFPDNLVESELGEIPDGWEVKTIGDLVTLNREGVNPSDYPDEVFDHFSIPAFDEGQMPKAEAGAAIKSNKHLVSAESVLLSKLNPRIPRVWLPSTHADVRSICSTEFLVASPNSNCTRAFLYCLFSSQSFLNEFATLVTGTSGSHQRVKPPALMELSVVAPPSTVVEQFTATVLALLKRIEKAREESRTLSDLRDTLLPKLISGDLRVKDPSRFLSEVPV